MQHLCTHTGRLLVACGQFQFQIIIIDCTLFLRWSTSSIVRVAGSMLSFLGSANDAARQLIVSCYIRQAYTIPGGNLY